MKILSLSAVALLATSALLSSGCSEPSEAPAPTPPAADGDAGAADTEADTESAPDADAGGSGEKAGSSTSSTMKKTPKLTAVSFNVEDIV